MSSIAIIGLYTSKNGVSDGQSIKTNIVADELAAVLGADQIHRINTFGWKKHPLKLFFKSIMAVQRYDNVIFMTDEGGIKIFPWLLYLSNIFKKCRLHYVVIGGWLTHFPEKHKILSFFLKKFHGIYVETLVMKNSLNAYGFNNIYLLPNCKRLPILSENELIYSHNAPFSVCTFSRVMREKGIEEAVNAVRTVNKQFNKVIYKLDIYGAVDPSQVDWFDSLRSTFPDEINYCGIIPYDQAVEAIKKYHALLYPTKLFTVEGVPGTIIDSYASGVPVIFSEWENFSDTLESGFTGIGYPMDQPDELINILIQIAENPGIIHTMKINCLNQAKSYLPQNVLDTLIRELA